MKLVCKRWIASVAALLPLIAAGCPTGEEFLDTDGTTGMGPMDSTGPSSMSSPMPTSDSPSGPGMTSSNPTSTTGDGPLAACVDEDIGMVVAAGVVTVSNEGAGNDFNLEYCGGGSGTDSFGTWGTTYGTFGTSDSWGTTNDTFSTSTFGTSDTFGTSGGTFPTTAGTFGTTSNDTFSTGGTFGTSGTWDGTFGATSWGSSGSSTTFGGGGSWGEDYVVQWTAPATGNFVFSTDGSNFDTVLGVFPPMCGGNEHLCNDDCFGLQSAVFYSATAGETLFIVIEGYGGTSGALTLSVAQDRGLNCYSGGSSSTTDAWDTGTGGWSSTGDWTTSG